MILDPFFSYASSESNFKKVKVNPYLKTLYANLVISPFFLQMTRCMKSWCCSHPPKMNGSPFLSSHLESSKEHQEEKKSQRVHSRVPSPTSSIKSVKCQGTLPLPFLQTTRVETMHQPLDAENVTQVSQVDVSADKRNRLGEDPAFLQENKKLYRLLRSFWWSLERKSLMVSLCSVLFSRESFPLPFFYTRINSPFLFTDPLVSLISRFS